MRLYVPIIVLVQLAGAVSADTIRLRDVAVVDGGVVYLGDVAALDGAAAEALERIVVGRLHPDQVQIAVELATVRAILDGLGVHWGKLSLTGHQACRVERRVAQPLVTDESITLVNPRTSVDSRSAVSLRQQLIARIVSETGDSRDDLTITFSQSDQKALSQSAMGRRFEIQPKSRAALGRIPFVIREWRDRRAINEYRVTADVALRTLAVVATRSVQRGAPFGQADIEVREVMVRDSRGRPLALLDQVIGQTARGIVRRGAVIYPEYLRSPLLVRRGELIDVRGVFGELVLTFRARARADGERGRIVMCRRDGTRKEFPVRITGMRRGETVAGDTAFDSSTGRMALK